MKALHRPDLFCWSRFDEARNIDFNSVVWVRPQGNVVFDPLPLTDHDKKHLQALGGVAWIAITNSHHVRDAVALASEFKPKVAAPLAERSVITLPVDRWLSTGDELDPGLRAISLDGSKTPGELAFLLEETTLITGDLIRAHRGGSLMWLPEEMMKDPEAARRSARAHLDPARIQAVLVGDGWHCFGNASAELKRLLD